MGVHYESLPTYDSYELAWLGPILYPLTLAILAQAYVVRDILLTSWGSARPSFLTKKLTGLAEVPAPDARVTILTCTVLLAEAVFALFCIVQCIVNFSSRSFAGGANACDLQAFYATYYTFASAGAFALVTVYGARIVITNGGCVLFSRNMVLVSSVGVHAAALLIAALPLMGVGEYMFATDYCQDNVEGDPSPQPLGALHCARPTRLTVPNAAPTQARFLRRCFSCGLWGASSSPRGQLLQ